VGFDDAFQVAAAGDAVYFGSSVDDKVHALDAATGHERWSFFTGGPVRLAPTVWEGKVYVGSDDGFVYCLNAANGDVVWKLRGGPNGERLLGHGRMISRWPIRTGVLVDGGIAYFGAGLFPYENVYLYAVDANSGRVVWRNDTISEGEAYRNEFTPQGYMLASGDKLFIPCGRALPAAFDRATGRRLFQPSYGWRGEQAGGVIGGTYALLADDQIYTGTQHHLLALDQNSGRSGFGWFPGRRLAVVGTMAYLATGTEIVAMDRTAFAEASRKRNALEFKLKGLSGTARTAAEEELKKHNEQTVSPTIRWRLANNCDAELIVTAGAVIAGGQGQVVAIDPEKGTVIWESKVAGKASGLAVAGGRLFVSTDKGKVYCFSSAGDIGPVRPAAPTAAEAYPKDELTAMYEQAAETIIAETGVTKGYCLVLGAERGRLAHTLARRTDLHVIGVEPDAGKVAEARLALDAAGVYGKRVVIEQGDLSQLPYSNYFANLIVSDSLLVTGKFPFAAADIARHVKPCGGVVCMGATAIRPKEAWTVAPEALEQWVDALGLGATSRASDINGRWCILQRGKLPGAGSWTHQYAEAGNTACSDDRLVSGPLGLLWFGEPGPAPMVNRHNAAAAPLAVNGRMFVQGEHNVMAYDSYNGTLLWKRDIVGAMRDGVKMVECGNLAADEASFFVAVGPECLRLDAETGKTIATYSLVAPDGGRRWGYTACVDGVLYGSALKERGVSDVLFAYDVDSGRLLWQYGGANIGDQTIAIGDGWMFMVDSSLSPAQREAFLAQDKSRFAKLAGDAQKEAERAVKATDLRLAVALDARTGAKLWERAVDVTDCSTIGIGGGELSTIYRDGVVVLCGANANGHYWRQFLAGEFSRRRLVALAAGTGDVLWAKDANYRHRPVVVGDAIIAEPWKFELKTGRAMTRVHPVTGTESVWQFLRPGHHCGAISACADTLFMRSGYTSWYDLRDDSGIRHFAGHRLGCWINAIPADGLALMPEASAGCVCLYPIMCTVVLEPRADHERWGIYSAAGSDAPVEHLAINLGAPGDRRDTEGTLWLAYPRPAISSDRSAMGYALTVEAAFGEGGGFTTMSMESAPAEWHGHLARESWAGCPCHMTARPWLFASAARGLQRLTIPVQPGGGKADYLVRLYLAEYGQVTVGACVFDIKLQGAVAAEGVDVVEEAGGAGKAVVRELTAKAVEKDLIIEFVPRGEGASAKVLPTLCAVEVIRRKEAPKALAALP
jgi:outer membrane protein assembly factor BamB